MMGFGFLQTQVMDSDVWLTPPEILHALGPFDLDPCSPISRPWDTAARHLTVIEDGLLSEWSGRVWLNPPYGRHVWNWMDKLSSHRNGLALIFARTSTAGFHSTVFNRAHSLLFLQNHLHFHLPDGTRAKHNSGAGSVLVSYDESNSDVLHRCGLKGKLVFLNN